jgi:3-oxoacyl-[acyl-carrier-protein] synthase-1
MVIAVDSLLDVDTLDWLNLLKRLKTEDRPAGVVPGEACCSLLLQTAAVARRHKRHALCVVDAVGLAAEPHNLLAGQASPGAVMAKLIDDAKQHSSVGTDNIWFVIDHNGETARASEWGNSLFHLARRHPDYANAQTWYPALGFGDTAAASGGVAACIAIAAWERAYAPSATAFICSAADGPERAVLCLERAA